MIESYVVNDPETVDALAERLSNLPTTALAEAVLTLLVVKDTHDDELARRRDGTPRESFVRLHIDTIHFGDSPFLTGYINSNESTTARLNVVEDENETPGQRKLALHVLRNSQPLPS